MSQKNNILNPWIWGISTGLLMAAVYSPHFLQWYSSNTSDSSTSVNVYSYFDSSLPQQGSFNQERPAYFSQSPMAAQIASRVASSEKLLKTHLDSKAPSVPVQRQQVPKSGSVPVKQPETVKSSPEVKPQNSLVPQEAIQNANFEALSETVKAPTLDELNQSMVIVEYENELVVEFEKRLFSNRLMAQLLTRLILSPMNINQLELLEAALDKTAFTPDKQPYFYQKITNSRGEPLRYPAQALDYSRSLLQNNREDIVDQGNTYIQITIPLSSSQQSVESVVTEETPLPYSESVNKYADKFQVDKRLVYAIMEVESAFNPDARSVSNALGLMQIKQKAAGKDVYQLIDGLQKIPSERELLEPDNNIRVGTAYLSLLKDLYFNQVKNSKNREMLVISAYNGGLNTVLKLFDRNPDKAVAKINRLTPSQLYQRLRYQHPSSETRRYLDKVLETKKRLMKA